MACAKVNSYMIIIDNTQTTQAVTCYKYTKETVCVISPTSHMHTCRGRGRESEFPILQGLRSDRDNVKVL